MSHEPKTEHWKKQVIKSFKMGTGSTCRKMCEKAIERIIKEKNRELRESNPKALATDFLGEVIMTGENVRVNLYSATDKDAVSFGEQYTLIRLKEKE